MHEAFLEDILANPHDDTPRLIYADWLEDNGAEDRAEFIRVQCALQPLRDRSAAELRRKGRHAGRPCRHLWPEMCADCRDLAKREHRLLTAERDAEGWSYWIRWAPGQLRSAGGALWHYRRGFIYELILPRHLFHQHAPAVCAAHPVERVVLTDRSPMHFGREGWWWYFGDTGGDNEPEFDCRHHLWPVLAGRVKGTVPSGKPHCRRYDSEAEAWDDAAQALAKYARSLATSAST